MSTSETSTIDPEFLSRLQAIANETKAVLEWIEENPGLGES